MEPYGQEAMSYLLFYMIILVSSICLCTTQHLLRPSVDNNTALWPFLQNTGPGSWKAMLLSTMWFYRLESSLNIATKTLWGHRARLSGIVSKYQLFSLLAILRHQCLCPLFRHQCPVQKVSKMIDSGGNYTSTLLAHWKRYKNDFNYLWNSDNLILFCALFNLDFQLLLSVCFLFLIRRIATENN